MPLPRREKTTYNDIRQPNTEQVPHIPSLPEGPVCIKQSVKEYRDRVMPDWFQKVTEEADKCQKLKRGRARYGRDGGGPSGVSQKEKKEKSKSSVKSDSQEGSSPAPKNKVSKKTKDKAKGKDSTEVEAEAEAESK